MTTSDTETNFYIRGFTIENFRSFRGEPAELGPFGKINIIIGANNSGKSNILRYIRRIYPKIIDRSGIKEDATDRPQGSENARRYSVLLGFKIPHSLRSHQANVARVLRHGFSDLPDGLAKFSFISDGKSFDIHPHSDAMEALRTEIYNLWSNLTSASGGDIGGHWMPGLLEFVFRANAVKPNIVFVPAYRKLQSRLSAYHDDYGQFDPTQDEKIIEQLGEISQPSFDEQEKKKDFRKIVEFIRDVMNEKHLELEIPHDRKTITVQLHGKSLPIEALGTGIHELVLLASKAVMQHQSVVCIEEPELHFHPELQRQFMRFIYEQTNNQYFITTHSAHIMDAVPSTVHRVYLEKGTSRVTRPITGNERRAVCHELGYRPSDLLQSNCAIWVEGPSDRIYLNHWLHARNPELIEGLHYSIMFYGGALRSHLSAEDAIVDDLISLLPINRFPVMIVDSDRKSGHAPLNATKRRMRDELEKTGLCWITKGREIENYIEKNVLEAAVKATHKKALALASEDRSYGKPLNYMVSGKVDPITENFDKVGIARRVCEAPANFTVLDLNQRMKELVAFIQQANRLIGTSIR